MGQPLPTDDPNDPNPPPAPVLPPLPHQASYLEHHSTAAAHALFWEMGTGKTKALIDNAAVLAADGLIDAVLVLAPNGVHRNWHTEELPKHWPPSARPYTSWAWDTARAATVAHASGFAATTATPRRVVVWLCMSYDALMTDAGRAAAWKLLRSRRCLYIADESQRIKTPGAARTKRALASAVYAPYRRLASGTPMDTPFDIYSQMRFLDPNYWIKALGIGSFTAFKAYFGSWSQAHGPGGRIFPMLLAYKDLATLSAAIEPASSRVTKADALNLPPKSYSRLFHPLTPAQRQVYTALKEEAMAVLTSGEVVTTEHVLTLHLRLTQVGCGFITPAAGEQPVPFTPNPRAQLLTELLRDIGGPVIVWARFVHDTLTAAAAARAAGRTPVIFDGADPTAALDAFHGGTANVIIANLESNMREGYTLNEASSVIYYSNTPKLMNRQQSEDRCHRIGQHSPVTYYDLLAERTLDAFTLGALRSKRTAVGTVMGEDLNTAKQWLLEALS